MPSFWRLPTKGKARRQGGVTASGQVIDLRDRNITNTLAQTRMQWQDTAWRYRDLIGELGAALRLKANIISKVQFVPAAVAEGDDEPVVVTGDKDNDTGLAPHVADAATDCLSRLPFGNGYAFQGMISQSFDVTGECWLHGYPDEDGDEQWQVLSTSEVVPSLAGLGVIEVPGRPARPVDVDTEALIRLWVPHPQWKQLADSPMRMMLDPCEDVVLNGRELRMAAMSRIAANGVFLVPNELSMTLRGEGALVPERDSFQAQLTAAIMAPINNEADVGAVAPIVIRGEAEDLKEARHLRFDRESSTDLLEKIQASLDRVANSLDLPPEAMKGVGDANHWSAWLIDASTFKNHVEPSVRMIADSITESFFRRTLTMPETAGGYGLSKDEALSVQVWYQAGNVTENANRSQDADQAMDRGAISYDAYRTAKGFGDGDAPSEDDLRQIALMKAGGGDSGVLAQLATAIYGTQPTPPAPVRVVGERTNTKAVGPGQVPAEPLPETTPPGARVAAGAPGVRVITGAPLADLDRELRDRLRQAGDDALLRALEKAGSRIKAKAQRTELAARVKGLEPGEVAPVVGQAKLGELGLTEDILLAAAFTPLGLLFTRWVGAHVKATGRTVAELVGLPLTTVAGLTQTMLARVPSAWKRLEDSLRGRALDKLYGRAGDELRGEVPDSITLPGDVRDALAEVGGGGGGIALGNDVLRAVDSRAERLGFIWRYGVTPRERSFEPHRQLAGQRFTGFEDPALVTKPEDAWAGPYYRPGQQPGCMCDYIPAWALPTADTLGREVLVESDTMRGDRLLADLDRAAGRTGTSPQHSLAQRNTIIEVQRAWLQRRAPT
jgi:hypothetical protein